MNTGLKLKKKVVCLLGPTAVGKTAILPIFSKECEVINADSRQVYKYLNIGSAKPSSDILEIIPHYLIDFLDLDRQYNAGLFVEDALNYCKEISDRGKIPLICGGTGFYFVNFIYGLPETPASVPGIKKYYTDLAEKIGVEELWRKLREVDFQTAERLSKSDKNRIIRALEVYEICGKSLSSFHKNTGKREEFDFLIIGLIRDRKELYERINRRTENMFEYGLEREVRDILSMGYSFNDPGLNTIGYREFIKYFPLRKICYNEVLDNIAQNSRRYAKRQITFFKKYDEIKWFHPDQGREISETLDKFIYS